MVKKLNSLIVLFKAYQSLEKNVKLSLINTELTVNEFVVMEALYSKKQLSTQQLIDSVLIPNSSMTYVLDELEKRNYISRFKDQNDKRRQFLVLTKQGKELFVKVYEKHYQHMKSIFNILSKEENSQLQEYLKRIGKKAEEVIF